MKVAYLLSGFVRNLNNLKIIKKFLQKNSNHCSIDVYSNTYDKVGIEQKTFNNEKFYINSKSINSALLCKEFKFKKLIIESYDQVDNEVNHFISNLLNETPKKIFFKYEVDKINIFNMLRHSFSQWRGVYKSMKLIEEDYDLIIKSRYDLDVQHLNISNYLASNNTIFYSQREGFFETKLDNNIKLNLYNDWIFFGKSNEMRNLLSIGSQTNFKKVLGNPILNSMHFIKHRNKDIKLSNEAILSFWGNNILNLNFKKINPKTLPYQRIMRLNKNRRNNFFEKIYIFIKDFIKKIFL